MLKINLWFVSGNHTTNGRKLEILGAELGGVTTKYTVLHLGATI